MIEFENKIEIKKPITEVFAFISDFENIPKWNYYVFEVKKISKGKTKVGTIFHQTRKSDKQSFKIIEYETDKEVTIQTLPNSSPAFEMIFNFVALENGTRLIYKWKLDSGKLRLIEKLLKNKVRKAVMQNLMKLKELLENRSVQLQDGRLVQI